MQKKKSKEAYTIVEFHKLIDMYVNLMDSVAILVNSDTKEHFSG